MRQGSLLDVRVLENDEQGSVGGAYATGWRFQDGKRPPGLTVDASGMRWDVPTTATPRTWIMSYVLLDANGDASNRVQVRVVVAENRSGGENHRVSTTPLVYVNSHATYSILPDGTRWRQLNECSLGPLATNGRQIVGAFSNTPLSPALALVPADKEVVNDCDNGPRDPSVLRYRLQPRGTQPSYWTTLAWSPEGRRILGVGSFGTGYAQRSRIAVFNPNGAGYHVLSPSLDGSKSSVTAAAWSPQGDRIVFGRVFKSGDCPEFVETKTVAPGCRRSELAVMNADGSGVRSLYRPPQIEDSQVDDLPAGSALRKLPSPIFTPFAWHGERIFLTDDDQRAGTRIAVVGADGTGFRYLTGPGSLSGRPALSPDGKQIALVWLPGCVTGNETGCGKSPSLYVMSSGGGPLRKVQIRQPLTSATCERGSLPGRKTCTGNNIGFDHVTW